MALTLALSQREGNPTGEKTALAVLNRLAAAFDELPVKATLTRWAKAWEKLAGQTGLAENHQSVQHNSGGRSFLSDYIGSGFRVQGSGFRISHTSYRLFW